MNVLDRLDQRLEGRVVFRNWPIEVKPAHLRALLDVARAAEKDWQHITAEMSEALAPLLEDTDAAA